jgi:hypothetical protein
VEEAPPGESIVVPAGTYTLTSGELAILKPLTIEGQGAAETIIRSAGGSRVMLAIGEFEVTISGVTIRDGVESPPTGQGAGLLAVVARLTLRDAVLTNNSVVANGAPGNSGGTAQGAGLMIVGALEMTSTRVSDNSLSAVGGSGASGGFAQGAGILAVGPLSVSNSTIANNRIDARGGQGPSSPEQDGGFAQGAGLLWVQNEGEAGSLTTSTVSGNLADASGGPGGTANLVQGAGVLLGAGAAATISNTTIANNAATALPEEGNAVGGGLIAVATSPGSSLTVVGSTFSGNRIEAPSPAGQGGGNIAAVGNVRTGGTIVAGGVGPAGSENCFVFETQSLGFNLDSRDQCGFHGSGDQVNRDPQLGPLQGNGGPTETMLPAASSPAVDQGAAFGLTADQRGVQRPIDFPTIPNAAGGDGSDVGAAELQPSNDITLGKLRRSKKKGTATLTVFIPQPSAGLLQLRGKGLKPKSVAIAGQAKVKLKVAGKRKVRKALRRRGKRKVGLRVTYTPTGNTPETLTRKTKLVKKKKKKRPRLRTKR